MLGNSTHNVLPECSEICVLYEGPGRPTAWPEQSQVVVETVTKTSTTQKFAAVQQIHESDATKVTATGAGLQYPRQIKRLYLPLTLHMAVCSCMVIYV